MSMVADTLKQADGRAYHHVRLTTVPFRLKPGKLTLAHH